ncbi:probable polygalacturonase [Physcomitrium patens]|uniref:Pectate lyase superfamily protein domain-containing protein n=1 Tax=Physcomitrium patens TaxID=3218 RepID=A0A2K1IYE4_PHYPA|nr:probable polygalacturonase [Physcomitrium patens]PNR34299.1 hypothetical protein PHYPA_024116 [Physcomitrium patens]|eukprot:XP_024403717.1 probable polygalacturonase [Physcomitrella patens]
MIRRYSYQSLRFLLFLLSCVGPEKFWPTCIVDHSLAEGFSQPDGIGGVMSPMDLHTSFFGHHTSKQSCAHIVNVGKPRPLRVSITDFGAVGDGKTLNTKAFENALQYLHSNADSDGAQLTIPAGRWLTGSINLISHLTLFLENGANILGSEDFNDYPIIPELPSYGRGRELPGARYSSLINGDNLEDVTITGENGTIDGQGGVWWKAFRNKTLDYSRSHVLELIGSQDILIFNLTFQNSPSWTIHPVYCKNVVIKNLTVLNPNDSPNTDGIDPDSSQHVCIEDCYISVGDDAISIKSGWDQYGISYGMPSKHIQIRRIVSASKTFGIHAGVSFGSEMSGGISNVKVDDMVLYGARWGVRFKTSPGRGGYIKHVAVHNLLLHSVKTAVAFMANYGQHPDDNWNRTAYPVIENIVIKNIVGENITQAGILQGLPESPFRHIHLKTIALDVRSTKNVWNCSWVSGSYFFVVPQPCADLTRQNITL